MKAAHEYDYEVAIVSMNAETLDGLQAYLEGAGIAARCARDLGACAKVATQRTLAVVLFPDDFRWDEVILTLADLAERRSPALPVLVTAHPQRFEDLTTPREVLIVPKPVWGWTILDAIREQVERRKSSRKR